MDWYDSIHEAGQEITFLPCNHWTMRNPIIGPNRSLWGSYLIKTSGGFTIYISGDTAYFDGFDQIGEQYQIDLAVFNLGAYEPRWFMQWYHVNPEEAVLIHRDIRSRYSVAMHWGTFILTDEPLDEPPTKLAEALAKHGVPESEFEVFNLGTGQGSTVLEVIQAFERATGAKLEWEHAPRRPGDIVAAYADTTKAGEVLGWRAERTLDEAMADAWRWQQSLGARAE